MPDTSNIVTIFGGSGFVGKYIARRMAKNGWRVRVAVRRPNEAVFVRPYGTVGQVEPILANVRNEDSVRQAISGASAVINCVGILQQSSKQRFDSVQAEAAGTVARIAAEENVAQLVHLSAIGADNESESLYAQSKARGEKLIREAFPSAVILRPSVIFGDEDGFFNRFAGMAKFGPVMPLVGGDTLFQPVYVDDVAKAASMAAEGKVPAGIYELGGPDVESLSTLVKRMLDEIRKRRLVLNMPFFVGSIMGSTFDFLSLLTAGLFTNTVLTSDQVKLLQHDNVVAPDAKKFSDLGIEPTSMEAVMPEYLYQYRPYGQYAALTESADNLASVRNSRSTAE